MEAAVFASRLETAAKHIELRIEEANGLLSRIEAAVSEAIDAAQDPKSAASETMDADTMLPTLQRGIRLFFRTNFELFQPQSLE